MSEIQQNDYPTEQEFVETQRMPVETMMTEDIGKLALALSKAQGDITGALKDSTNPFFKSNYADLGNVLAACREPLSKNELAVIQTTEPSTDGVTVVSTLVHSSGQWIRGRLKMKPVKNDPQGIGSTITYARRYSYAAIVGVAQVDDDGNQATVGAEKPPKRAAKPPIDPTVKADAVAALSGCTTMEELESAWKSLSADQHTAIGKLGLTHYKSKIGEKK